MDGLDEAVSSAAAEMASLEYARESAISCSRRVIRMTKRMIHNIHAGAPYDDEKAELMAEMTALTALCDSPAVLTSGPIQDAMGEYAEAMILEALISGREVPTFDGLGISPGAWLLGLADTEGEIRRAVMTRLMDGNLEGARELFSVMEEVHEHVMLLDISDALIPMRRKQDISRGVMERTRSDMTAASIMDVGKM